MSNPLKTYRDLRDAFNDLTEEQLDMSITVSEGCDENANAEFVGVIDFVMANNDMIAAATDGVLEDNQPVLIIDNGE